MDRRRLLWPLAGWLSAGAACFWVIGDTDAGWHLALGRSISQHGLVHENALAWTARDFPWYDTSWLWDWTTYALTARFGLFGLQLATFANRAALKAVLGRARDRERRQLAALRRARRGNGR